MILTIPTRGRSSTGCRDEHLIGSTCHRKTHWRPNVSASSAAVSLYSKLEPFSRCELAHQCEVVVLRGSVPLQPKTNRQARAQAQPFCALGRQFMSVPPQIRGEHHQSFAFPFDIN